MRYFFNFLPLLILLFSFDSLRVQGERLASFSAVRIDDSNVEVRWVLKANVSCQSPQVQRSSDGANFNTLYTYPGVCGGSPNEEKYSWIDSDALQNKTLYYRLRIDDAEFSVVDQVESVKALGKGGVLLYPNPSSAEVFIQYEPSFGNLEAISVYSINGQEILLKDEQLIILDRGMLKFHPNQLGEGIYFLECLFSAGIKRQVKLIYGF